MALPLHRVSGLGAGTPFSVGVVNRSRPVATRQTAPMPYVVSPLAGRDFVCHIFLRADDNTGIHQPRPGNIQNTDPSHVEIASRPRNMHPFGARRAVISGK